MTVTEVIIKMIPEPASLDRNNICVWFQCGRMEEGREGKAAAGTTRNDESDSDRKTPSSDAGSNRADTPGVMPKYMYSKVGHQA